MTRGYLKLSSLCEYSDLSRRTLQGFLKSGQVPFIRLKGLILVKREDWDLFMDAHKEQGRTGQIVEDMLQ